ncbi:hypothetical protein [Phyllobacterium chamaecytisi]|uniref:hypothetical protein n=1 Tax=Phyllobacterium chamaecytisi TaxID=2876082 RepID=UPI001CCF6727|nr:hypothetical protein [Phyllobacterium sp. KW56]MBZ9600745.1 hypothetical protein [Phyllobacterium sp. KW56]
MSNTIRVKPWSDDQGDFVIINEADFDPKFHELLDAAPATKPAAPASTPAPVDTGDKTALEVLALADGNFMSFKSAAKKLLGDKTPSTKPEIIAALEELATTPE